jgi:hypothetical protein
MPSISVVPWHCRVSYATIAGYTIGPDDCTIVADPTGITKKGPPFTIQLPDTNSPVPPASGDFYLVADSIGVVNVFHHLVVQAGPTYTINGGASLVFTKAFSWVAVQFDGRNKKWAVFQGKLA